MHASFKSYEHVISYLFQQPFGEEGKYLTIGEHKIIEILSNSSDKLKINMPTFKSLKLIIYPTYKFKNTNK